eukprot:scaffold9285_cov40-Tisochrysis_lutea.AAC.1
MTDQARTTVTLREIAGSVVPGCCTMGSAGRQTPYIREEQSGNGAQYAYIEMGGGERGGAYLALATLLRWALVALHRTHRQPQSFTCR